MKAEPEGINLVDRCRNLVDRIEAAEKFPILVRAALAEKLAKEASIIMRSLAERDHSRMLSILELIGRVKELEKKVASNG